MNDKTKTNGKEAKAAEATPFPAVVSRTLQGVAIEIPCIFKPGQTLTFDEAVFCSHAWAGAARSAYEDRAKANLDPNRTVEEGEGDNKKTRKVGAMTAEQLRADFAAYFDNYVWTPRGDAVPLDPVEAEVRKIARNELELALKAKGYTLQGLGKLERDAALAKYIDKPGNRTRLEKVAKANIAQASANLSEDFLAEMGVRKVGEKPAEETAAAT